MAKSDGKMIAPGISQGSVAIVTMFSSSMSISSAIYFLPRDLPWFARREGRSVLA